MYAEFMPRVLGYALRRTDAEEARDVVSETFTVATVGPIDPTDRLRLTAVH